MTLAEKIYRAICPYGESWAFRTEQVQAKIQEVLDTHAKEEQAPEIARLEAEAAELKGKLQALVSACQMLGYACPRSVGSLNSHRSLQMSVGHYTALLNAISEAQSILSNPSKEALGEKGEGS